MTEPTVALDASSNFGGTDSRAENHAGRVTAPALRRGLDILELFLEHNDGLRVPEITEKLGIPRASVHELVGALVDRGYLRPASESSTRFRLGVRAFELGGAYERDLDLVASGRAAARRVAAECGETVQVVIRDGDHVIYIVKIDSTHSIRIISHVGGRLPAWCTAVGKVLLAHLTTEEIDALFPDDASLVPMTPQSIQTRRRLDEELRVAKAQGWAEEHSESNEDASCVAVPIYDRTGACVAAMSITVPNIRWDEADRGRYIALVAAGAGEVSRELGWAESGTA